MESFTIIHLLVALLIELLIVSIFMVVVVVWTNKLNFRSLHDFINRKFSDQTTIYKSIGKEVVKLQGQFVDLVSQMSLLKSENKTLFREITRLSTEIIHLENIIKNKDTKWQ
jgi:peptidoglycan hydrolase CwlO-like protein